MASLFSIIVAVGACIGWVVYLAGIASSQSVCVQFGKGTLLDPIKSVEDPSKYVPMAQPWSKGFDAASIAAGALAAAAGASGSGSAGAGASGRKMLSIDPFMSTRGRALLDVVDNGCGWSYSLEWWTVALQGLALVGILMLLGSNETVHKLKQTFFAFLAVNTTLLCIIASFVVPVAYNYNQVKAKGKAVDAVSVSTAGVIITLIFNFSWFITSSLEAKTAIHDGSAASK